jgi:hypothetical protein
MQPHTCSLAPKPSSHEELIQKGKSFVTAAKAPAILKAYRNDWRDFESWCREHQLTALASTPKTVALYFADRASTLASGTITRRPERPPCFPPLLSFGAETCIVVGTQPGRNLGDQTGGRLLSRPKWNVHFGIDMAEHRGCRRRADAGPQRCGPAIQPAAAAH